MRKKIRLSESDLNRLVQKIIEQDEEINLSNDKPYFDDSYFRTRAMISRFTKDSKKLIQQINNLDAELGSLMMRVSNISDDSEKRKYVNFLRKVKNEYEKLTNASNDINNLILTMGQRKSGGRGVSYNID